jgi:hypothetical protein
MSNAHSARPTADVNAMLWGQFHLRGGWGRLVAFLSVYAAAVGGLILLSGAAGAGVPGTVKHMLIAAQASILVLFAGARVSSAIRQDFNTRMIDSHRLMPLSPSQAVIGYVLGGAAGPLALAVVNVALGLVASAAVGTPVALWLTANAVLFGFGAFAAVAMAFGAFSGRTGGSTFVWLALFFTVMSSGGIGAILPGMILLVTPMIRSSVFSLGVTGADAAVLYVPPTLFQLWIGGVCFAAACRRYRREDRPALGSDLGVALVGGGVAVSLYAMFQWQEYRPATLATGAAYHPAMMVGSTALAMLAGLVPLAGAAFSAADWESRRELGDPALGRRPAPPVLVAALCAVLALALVFAPLRLGDEWPLPSRGEAVLDTAVVLASFFVAMASVLRVLYRRRAVPLFYALAPWLLVTWLLPIGIDTLRWYLLPRRDRFDDAVLGTPSSFSPLGALIQIWTGRPESITPGLAFQALLAVALAALYHFTRPRSSPPTA